MKIIRPRGGAQRHGGLAAERERGGDGGRGGKEGREEGGGSRELKRKER